MSKVYLTDSIEPCKTCGGKRFGLIFRDGSNLPERQANERCNDCGEERPRGAVRQA